MHLLRFELENAVSFYFNGQYDSRKTQMMPLFPNCKISLDSFTPSQVGSVQYVKSTTEGKMEKAHNNQNVNIRILEMCMSMFFKLLKPMKFCSTFCKKNPNNVFSMGLYVEHNTLNSCQKLPNSGCHVLRIPLSNTFLSQKLALRV